MDFNLIGVSVHSVEEAIFAEKMGAGYVTAGHIFLTDCKKGLAARGLPFLKNVCESVGIPVYMPLAVLHRIMWMTCWEQGRQVFVLCQESCGIRCGTSR